MAPVFILGFPRSGTTALASAISSLPSFQNFTYEGHIFYLFQDGLQRLRDGRTNPNCIMNEPAKRERFYQIFREAFNQAFSDDGDKHAQNWIDKTPDIAQVSMVPELSRLYPDAHFIYIYRTAETAVRSNVATWPQVLTGKEEEVAHRWAACNEKWRRVRAEVPASLRLELFQPEMLSNPGAVGQSLATFLKLPGNERTQLTQFLEHNKSINRPGGKKAKEYDAQSLTDEALEMVRQITAKETAHWPKLQRA